MVLNNFFCICLNVHKKLNKFLFQFQIWRIHIVLTLPLSLSLFKTQTHKHAYTRTYTRTYTRMYAHFPHIRKIIKKMSCQYIRVRSFFFVNTNIRNFEFRWYVSSIWELLFVFVLFEIFLQFVNCYLAFITKSIFCSDSATLWHIFIWLRFNKTCFRPFSWHQHE